MAMNQNAKLKRIKDDTLIVGIDIAKRTHVARAIDWRGVELGKPLTFENNANGFQSLLGWMDDLQNKYGKSSLIVGMEPTGHYWFNVGHFLRDLGIAVVHVNPAHTKKVKELDDNSPTKNDVKDALVIARLVKDGRFAEPIIPEGVYAELRNAMRQQEQINLAMQQYACQIHNWLDRYFPELSPGVFKDWDGKAVLALLRTGWLPGEIAEMSPEEIVKMWREAGILRGVGIKAAKKVIETAKVSVGVRKGPIMARQEIQSLMARYDLVKEQKNILKQGITELLSEIPGADYMLQIPGAGLSIVAGFLAEVGDLSAFCSPRQINKLAGLSLMEDSSGLHKGQTIISKRGRKKLRAILYRAVFRLVAVNPEFAALHAHYKTRLNNPLKPKQSLVALCGRLIRILYTLGTRLVPYDPKKTLGPAYQTLIEYAA
jgi:transposase